MLEKFIAKLNPAFDDFLCEQYAEGMQEVLDSWSAALRRSTQITDEILSHLAETASVCSLAPSSTNPLRVSGPLRIERRFFSGRPLIGRERWAAELTEYLAPFKVLSTVEFEIYGIRAAGESPLTVETDIRFSLVGTARDGSREQRVGAWHLSWVKEEQQRWLVQSLSADPEVRSWLTGPGFSEITGLCLAADSAGMAQLLPGIDDWRTALDGARQSRRRRGRNRRQWFR